MMEDQRAIDHAIERPFEMQCVLVEQAAPKRRRRSARFDPVLVHAEPATCLQDALERDRQLLQSLTTREIDVANLLLDGSSNGDMARSLGVSSTTISFHLQNILTKLKVANRTRAATTYLAATMRIALHTQALHGQTSADLR